MRIPAGLIVIGISVMLIASCTPPNDKWGTYNGGSFSVWMPEKPSVFDKSDTTAFGLRKVHYISWKPATLELNKFKLFEVRYFDCPVYNRNDSVMRNIILDSAINRRKKDYTDNEITAEPIDMNGYPGRAFIYSGSKDNVVTIVKQINADNKIYDLSVVAKKDYATNKEISDFYNSFKVLLPADKK